MNSIILNRYQLWRGLATDAQVSAQLAAMENDEKAIEDAFYKELEFGTGGMRGEIGAGTNCFNIYTIARVTQGIADNMMAHGQKTAAVSHDSRILSDVFAATAARVFAYNGIKAYLTRELAPTPFLSYMTREMRADIGVMITASHNPAQYNGYKVYGADGCQLTDARSNEMIAHIAKVDPFAVKTETLEHYLASGSIEYVSGALERRYLTEVKKQACGQAEGLCVVYTPLNGAGYRLVPKILVEAGADLHIVPEQGMPDGRFLTCPFPNPEKAEALKLGLELARGKDADLLIATDPDGDRMGLAVKTADGYRLMTGNETGALLADYLLARRKENGTLPARPVIIKTIVSTELAADVAKTYGAQVFDVLTGFKYIGEVIGRLEQKGEAERFVFGFEESYGCLAGGYVRDKDAVVASMLAAEMTAHYKKQGKTLADRIGELYAAFGTYTHRLRSFEFPGAAGFAEMKRLLAGLRLNLPREIGGVEVVKTVDYLAQTEFELPPADVLLFDLSDGSRLIIRPSGTEPLIKMYLSAAQTPQENEKAFARLEEFLAETFG